VANPDEAKNEVRHRVWDLLTEHRAAQPDVHGSIPNFVGVELAARKLAELPAWRQARVVKVVPDKPQAPVRVLGLQQGKLLYVAVPKITAVKPFYELDPSKLPVSPEEAAVPKKAALFARTVDTDEMSKIDLLVCGTVAVNRRGVRLGKGAGYADIEVALLQEAGLISEATTTASVLATEFARRPLNPCVPNMCDPQCGPSCSPACRPVGNCVPTGACAPDYD
jgi:5-formyltetrahydrofolate cyclo-ligase